MRTETPQPSLRPHVAVVILNWNGKRFLEQFLPSVLESDYPSLEVVVGDNASTDGSAAFIRANFPTVRLLVNDRNYGFAGGYNRLLGQITADYFVLLNSDVEVPPGWITPVIRLMESDPAVAACQPKIKDLLRKDRFEYAGACGGFLDYLGYPFCRGRVFDTVEADRGQYNNVREVFWASGAAFFVRRQAFLEAGGFDEDFFAHMEEADLCWRLQRMGYRIMVCPGSEVYHLGGGTLKTANAFKTYLNFRNSLITLHKNLPGRKLFPVIFARFWLDLAAWFLFLFRGSFRHSLAINKAHWNYLKELRRWQQKRSGQPARQGTGEGSGPGGFGAVLYPRSIVFQYFLKGRKYFSRLPGEKAGAGGKTV